MLEGVKKVLKNNRQIIGSTSPLFTFILFHVTDSAEPSRVIYSLVYVLGFFLGSLYVASRYLNRLEKTTEAPILDTVLLFLLMIYGAVTMRIWVFFLGMMIFLGIVLAMGGTDNIKLKVN